MAVRCGYCGYVHDNAAGVQACGQTRTNDMRLLRKLTKPKLHPLNEAAFAAHAANAKRSRAAQKVTADAERNLEGVRQARAALRRQPA